MNSEPPLAPPRSDVPADTPWTKATRSADGGTCVELRRHAGAVEIRDSKDPTGPVLRLRAARVATWLAAARTGGLDHLR
jgi:hypothetical protein